MESDNHNVKQINEKMQALFEYFIKEDFDEKVKKALQTEKTSGLILFGDTIADDNIKSLKKVKVGKSNIFSASNPSYSSFILTVTDILLTHLKIKSFRDMNTERLIYISEAFLKVEWHELDLNIPRYIYQASIFIMSFDKLLVKEFINLQISLDNIINGGSFMQLTKDVLNESIVQSLPQIIRSPTCKEAFMEVIKVVQSKLEKEFSEHLIENTIAEVASNLFEVMYMTKLNSIYGETLGNKFIVFDKDFFAPILKKKCFNELTSAAFIITSVHEVTHFILRKILPATPNIHNISPRKTTYHDNGDRMEMHLFGHRLSEVGCLDSKYLLDPENWAMGLSAFNKNFKACVNKDKKNKKSRKTVRIKRTKASSKMFCGNNLPHGVSYFKENQTEETDDESKEETFLNRKRYL
jgi:hypothetical protein